MNILISNDSPFAHYYIRLGLARAFTSAGHNVIMWDINKKNVFDAFDEAQPDLFIGQTYNINDSLIKVLSERPMTKVIMKASDWGNISDEIDRKKYPVLIANDEEINNVRKLKDKAGKPDFVYVHYMQDRLKDTHTHWINEGIRVESLMNAADVFDFTNGEKRPEYECDIAFVGGRWGYKSVTFDQWFIPLLSPNFDYKIKIFGNQPWGVPQYCGFLPNEELKHLFASAKICINLSEPHSQKFGYDVVERPFKLWANKSFVISDFVEDLHNIYPDGIYGDTPQHFHEVIDYWLTNDKTDSITRQEIIDKNYKTTMKNHTYFHRAASIFKNLNSQGEEVKMNTAFATTIEKLGL